MVPSSLSRPMPGDIVCTRVCVGSCGWFVRVRPMPGDIFCTRAHIHARARAQTHEPTRKLTPVIDMYVHTNTQTYTHMHTQHYTCNSRDCHVCTHKHTHIYTQTRAALLMAYQLGNSDVCANYFCFILFFSGLPTRQLRCVIHVYTDMGIHTHDDIHVCAKMHMSTHILVYTHTGIHTYGYTHIHVDIHVCLLHFYACMWKYSCTCVYIAAYYTHTHTHTQTHTHNTGVSALHLAARTGQLHTLEALLDKDADVTCRFIFQFSGSFCFSESTRARSRARSLSRSFRSASVAGLSSLVLFPPKRDSPPMRDTDYHLMVLGADFFFRLLAGIRL